MKKIVLFTLLSAAVVVTGMQRVSADDHVRLKFKELPSRSQLFLSNNFVTPIYAEIYTDKKRSDFKVKMETGIKVEFDAMGAWREIEAENGDLPEGLVIRLLSANTRSYLAKNYPRCTVKSIERSNRKIELEVMIDGKKAAELEFDAATGKFIKEDK